MTKSQIEQLNKLQKDIEVLENALNVINCRNDLAIRYPCGNGYYDKLPTDKILGLDDQIKEVLVENFSDAIDLLREERDQLVICVEDAGKPTYHPYNLEP